MHTPHHRRGRATALTLLLGGALIASQVALPAVAGAARATSAASALVHAGTFFVDDNLPADEPETTPTSAEIVDLTPDGQTLLYTDALTGRLGFVDVSDPTSPVALGALDLPGGPTSVAIHQGWALVAVVTSEDPDGDGPLNEFDEPTGDLLVIDIASRATVRTLALGGQPDSVAVAPSGRYAAITIENERDEDESDGFIPQAPAGFLQIVDLAGDPGTWSLRSVDLTGLAEVAPSDPEPEYVDINDRDEAVISLQENNHLAIVDLRRGRVTRDFSAGSTPIDQVDGTEEEIGPQGNGLIELTDSIGDRRREPDTVAWIDDKRFATANEGDYEDADGIEGGSRSFTIFDREGRVQYEAGHHLEHEIVRAGHFPEGRAENKGNEPEGLEVGVIDGRTYLFVASERANTVAVYDVTRGTPTMTQLLPTGIGPEGLKLTADGLLAVTSETDGAEDGFLARPMITLFQAGADSDWSYPQVQSADDEGDTPIPWVALSGLAGDPHDEDTLWAVSDSFLAQAWLYRIDTSTTPATIQERIAIGGTDVLQQAFGDYDLEGVAARPEGGFWFASEGRTSAGSSRPNLIVRSDPTGTVIGAFPLPDGLVATANNSGFEGVTVTGTAATGDEVVWVAIQRPWAGDPANTVKLGRFEVATGSWTFARYVLDAAPAYTGAVVGLSEITVLPDGRFAIIERDNQLGQRATVKRIYAVDPASVTWAPYSGTLPTVGKSLLRDALADLDAASISVPDKLEGLGVAADGQVYLVTDNDGVDDNYGETVFVRLGDIDSTFAD